MKKNLVIIFSFLTISVLAESKVDSTLTRNNSTDIYLSSIDISSGKGAISSGLYLYFNLESDKAILQTTISENDLEITYFYRLFKDKILIGPNIGYFCNIPYGGAMVVFSPIKYISTLHWGGWSFGQPNGKMEPDASFLFGVNSITVSAWRFNVSYCLINYMKNKPQHTVSLKYTQAVSKDFSVYTDVGYDFKNENQLLKIGINWKP
ncbi:MAG: hypothetical protein WC582_03690 [Patescibacteria group bacterium]